MGIQSASDWGPEQSSVDHRLLITTDTWGQLLALDCGWSIGQPDYTETDRIQRQFWCYENGRMVPKTVTMRGSQIREITYQLMLPPAKGLWSPIDNIAGKDCKRDVILCRICPEDPENEYYYVLPNVTLDQVKRDTLVMEGGEGNGVPLNNSTQMHTQREERYFYLTAVEMQTAAAALDAVTFDLQTCAGCEVNPNKNGFYGGDEIFRSTSNSFTSGSAVAGLTLATGEVVTSILAEGDHIIVTVAGTATGRVANSTDGGASFTDTLTSGTVEFKKVIHAGNYYYVCGAVGAIYQSPDGVLWTAVVQTVAPAGVWEDMSYDPDAQVTYIAGHNAGATAGFAAIIRGSNVSDITAAVGATGDALYAVKVLGKNHVAFGGAAGFFSENPNVASSIYAVTTVGTATIRSIQGRRMRTVVAGGTILWQRTPCNELNWARIPYSAGSTVTGDYTDGATGVDDYGAANNFVFVTDDGEIVRVAPTYPGAL